MNMCHFITAARSPRGARFRVQPSRPAMAPTVQAVASRARAILPDHFPPGESRLASQPSSSTALMSTLFIPPDREARLRAVTLDPLRSGPGCVLLDANNGRLRGAMTTEVRAHCSASVFLAEQEHTRATLTRVAGHAILSLKQRMRNYGFIPTEPLIVFSLPLAATIKRRPGSAFIVAEGNCRLIAALEVLEEDELATEVLASDAPEDEKARYRRHSLTPAVRRSLRNIPAKCVEAETLADTLAAVALVVEGTHVVGKTAWSAYASGATVLSLFEAGLSIVEIARKLGENEPDVVRRLRTVSLLRQLKEDPLFENEVAADLYGHAHELLERKIVRDWLRFDEGDRSIPEQRPTFRALDPDALRHVAQLLVRKKYFDDTRRALPVAQRDVRRMRLVLEHPDRELLLNRLHGGEEKGWEILDALEESRRAGEHDERTLERLLRRAAAALEEADAISRRASPDRHATERLMRDIRLSLDRVDLNIRHASAPISPADSTRGDPVEARDTQSVPHERKRRSLRRSTSRRHRRSTGGK